MILSHPTGNANVRAAANGFAAKGILLQFRTTIAAFYNDFLYKLGDIRLFSDLKRRTYDSGLKPFTRLFPWFELGRMLSTRFKIIALTTKETGIFSIDSVYTHLDLSVAKDMKRGRFPNASSVYAYEDGAYHSFSQAKEAGITCIYDLPIGYWRAAKKSMSQEIEKWPAWESTMGVMSDSDAKLFRKDEEIRMADRIYVASHFTKQSLQLYPGVLPEVVVIPYGFPPVLESRDYFGSNHHPLKLLFVGGLSQRKGLANLFVSVDHFKTNVQLTIVGLRNEPHCEVLDTELLKHTWIPSLPHAQILELMASHDVLVFPSLFEGFGLVITEAMSQGTPVITTERTAGPEFIRHGENGWLVEAGSTVALTTCIETILSDRTVVSSAGKLAMETASMRPWSVYSDEISDSVYTYLSAK